MPAAGRIALADRVRHAASGRPLEVAHGKQCGQVTARRALPRRAALLRRLAGYDGVAWETIVSDGADDGVSALGVGVLVVALLFAGMPGWAGAQDTDSRADDALGCDLALLFSDEQLGKRNIDLRELCGFQLFNECRPVPVIIRTEDAGPDTDRHIRAVAEGHLRPAQIYGPPPAVGGLLAIEVLHYGGNFAYEVIDPSEKRYWVNVKFIRRVFEPVSEQWGAAETWRSRVWRSSTYTADTSGPGWHPILQLVSDGVGEFTNSYLRVNEPAC